jgi:hypothetical protein
MQTAVGAADVARSLADLADDFDDLRFLVGGAAARLERTLTQLAAVPPRTAEEVARGCRGALRRLRAQADELERLAAAASDGACSPAALARARDEQADLLRARIGTVGGLVTAADWQSPSFGHSLRPTAGRHSGRIAAHETDYQRDRHLDAAEYERAYVQAFGGETALLTSCGMAAFTTILAHLVHGGHLRHRLVVAGRGLYHETKGLLYGALATQVAEMDELVPRSIELAVEKLRPAALFFDAVPNTRDGGAVDLEWLLALLVRRGEPVHLVVDATCSAAAALPPALLGETGPVRVLVFESLLKYAQYGLDRSNAGVIVARGADAVALAALREHLGTNIPDTAVHALPPPDRERLLRRLARLERNAFVIAERLGVGCPSGSCVVLRLSPETPGRRQAFVQAALAAARRRGVQLVAGSSFGFDTTRVYVTAETAEHGAPFLRIAAGAEHLLGAKAVAEALADAL